MSFVNKRTQMRYRDLGAQIFQMHGDWDRQNTRWNMSQSVTDFLSHIGWNIPIVPINVYYYPYMVYPIPAREELPYIGSATTFQDIYNIILEHPETSKYGAITFLHEKGILLAFGGCS
jgi:hypothetical protein